MKTAEATPVRIGPMDDFLQEAATVVSIAGRDVAVLRRDDQWFAFDDHCPHKGASLAAGTCGVSSVACPWHGWKFDLRTGESLDHPGFRMATHCVEERDGELWVALSDVPSDQATNELEANTSSSQSESEAMRSARAEWSGAFRTLVRYGAMAWTGYFRATEHWDVRHGERVLIQSSRGTEVGEVLSPLSAEPPCNEAGVVIRPAGTLVRRLSPMESFDAVRRQRDVRAQAMIQSVLQDGERLVAERGVKVNIVDGELLFDGSTLVVYFLGPPTAELGRLAAELGQGREFKVVFNSVIEQSAGGGSCGCGSAGGCCSMTADAGATR